MVTRSRLYKNGHVIPILILNHFLLLTELLILFILQSYHLFHNTMMSDLPINQPTVEIMVVAGKKSVSFPKDHGLT